MLSCVVQPHLNDLVHAGFQELCCECYLVVRQHAHLFINLFSLLLPAGLYQEDELAVVRPTHCLDLCDTQHMMW